MSCSIRLEPRLRSPPPPPSAGLSASGPTRSRRLRLAGTQAAGLWEFLRDAADSNPLHTAQRPQAGSTSAYLAQEGLRSRSDSDRRARHGRGHGEKPGSRPSRRCFWGMRWALAENFFNSPTRRAGIPIRPPTPACERPSRSCCRPSPMPTGGPGRLGARGHCLRCQAEVAGDHGGSARRSAPCVADTPDRRHASPRPFQHRSSQRPQPGEATTGSGGCRGRSGAHRRRGGGSRGRLAGRGGGVATGGPGLEEPAEAARPDRSDGCYPRAGKDPGPH